MDDPIPFPLKEFFIRSRDFHILSLFLILFLIGISLIFSSLQGFLSLIISICVAFYIAIFSTEYAIFRNRYVEIRDTFENVFKEIFKNKERIESVLSSIDSLKTSWIRSEKGQWIKDKTIVRDPYSVTTRFIYQYLPNNAFKVMQSKSFDQIIKGAKNEQIPNYYHQLLRFYFQCVTTSEKSQRIEDQINDFIDLKEKHPQPIDDSIDVEKLIDGSGNLLFFHKPIGYKISEYNDLFVNGIIDNLKWNNFVTSKVDEIVDCFNKCKNNEQFHCSDLVSLNSFQNFFSTIVDQNVFYPPNLFEDLFGLWKREIYTILLSGVITIWITYFIFISECDVLNFILQNVGFFLIFLIFFIVVAIFIWIFLKFFF